MTEAATTLNSHSDRTQLEERACQSLIGQDFRASLAPLCRLLLTLDREDPERAVVLACLVVAYTRTGRLIDAERTLRSADAAAHDDRGRSAVSLARAELLRLKHRGPRRG